MKLFNLLLLILITSIASIAQPSSTYPKIPFTEFRSVDIVGNTIAANGSCDQLWTSTDGGETWKHHIVDDQSLKGIKLIPSDPNRVMIPLRNEVIIYDFATKDIVTSSTDGDENLRWAKGAMVDGDDLYFLNIEGLYHAKAGVYEWELIFARPEGVANFDVGDITDSFIYIGTSDGRVFRYDLAEGTHEERSNQFPVSISELTMGTDDIGYVIASGENKIQKTTDGGATFSPVNSLKINRNVHCQGADKVATVLGSSLEVSTDGGATAESYRMSNSKLFGNISNGFIADDGTIYAYGSGSTIAKSTDDGESFEFLSPYNRSDFFDITINEEGIGYACGEHGTVVQTIDHGYNWTELDFGISESETLTGIALLASGDLVISGYEGIHVVRDGQIVETSALQYGSMILTDQGSLLAHINNEGVYQVMKSTDGGSTWELVLDAIKFSQGMSQSNTGTIYVPTQSGDIYVSNDDGQNWTIADFSIELFKLYPYDDQLIMGASGNSLFRTTDGGTTWTEVYNAYLTDNIVFLSASSIYLTFAQNGWTYLMHSEDGGDSWTQVYQNCTATCAATANADGEIIMAQKTGHINMYPALPFTSVKDEFGDDDQLHIWPNPISRDGMLNVEGDWSSIDVHDIQGQIIKSFNQGEKELDLSAINTGMYILVCTQNGKRIAQKFVIQ